MQKYHALWLAMWLTIGSCPFYYFFSPKTKIYTESHCIVSVLRIIKKSWLNDLLKVFPTLDQKRSYSWRNPYRLIYFSYLPWILFFFYMYIFLPDVVQWINLIKIFCNITFQCQFRLVLNTLNLCVRLLSKEWFHILDRAGYRKVWKQSEE